MIDRVYIIGAGASVPYGLPTLKTLSWELAQSLSPASRSVFTTAIRDCFGTNLEKPADSPDFEELLNRLDPGALRYLEDSGIGGGDSDRRKAAELALSGLRTFFQDKCTNVGLGKGPFDVLVTALDRTALTVSFNWDILLEMALLRTGRTYCYLPSAHAQDAVVLLKPHGSINWYALLDREGLMISVRDSNLGVIGNDINNYLCYVVDPLKPVNFAACSPMVQHVLSRVPAIVPPIASKLLSVGGVPRDGFVEAGHTRAMKATWAAIVNAFSQARQVVAIGYSLPGTDAASIEAMKHFVRSGTATNPKRILLVEPNPAVQDRYQSVLGIDAKIVCSDFRDFDPSRL